jgi:uncharacterized repeat protein (TIGR01451 family)
MATFSSAGHPSRRKQLAAILATLLLLFSLLPSFALAVELPPPGNPTYIQTNAPATQIGRGDWYTASAAQNGGAGYGYLTIEVPCGWPAAKPIDVDLYSPEMNTTTTLADENDSGPLANTTFELYQPGTSFSSPATPAPGAAGSLEANTYAPSSDAPQWVRFYTIDVAATGCGTYILRSQSGDDDQNAWRIRVGDDDDANPNNAPPASGYDDADGIPGTGDELVLGLLQTTFQHDAGVVTCLDLYEFVSPAQPSVTFHNFDMDDNDSVRYYAPGSATAITGTVSGSTRWNGSGNTTRVGDTITNPAPGWWRIETCIGNHNQYIQEGQTGQPIYFEIPPTPVMEISKSDGLVEASANDVLTYTITFTNTSDSTSNPGAAANLSLTDTIPANATFLSCDANGLGNCAYVDATRTVAFALSGQLNAGDSAQVAVIVQVNDTVVEDDLVTNTVSLSYQDIFNRAFTPISATDVDVVVPPLGVQLAGFTASSQEGHILLKWETVSEEGVQGFHLYRSTEPDADGTLITDELIPAEAPGSTEGASYTWTDTDVETGVTYYYWLEAIDTFGDSTRHGPVSATYGIPTAVALARMNVATSASVWPYLAATLLTLLGGGLFIRRRNLTTPDSKR